MRQQVLQLMMTILESKLAQTHVALSGPNEAASTAADDDYISGIDFSRKTKTNILQQINFAGKLEEDDGAMMFFLAEKQQKTILDFSLDS